METTVMTSDYRKFFVSLFLCSFTLMSPASCIYAQNQIDDIPDENYNPTEIVSMGPDNIRHNTSTLSEFNIDFFCEGRKISMEIETREDLSDTEIYQSHVISAKIGNSPLPGQSSSNLSVEKTSNYSFIIPRFSCTGNIIGIYLYGYNDGSAESGFLIDKYEIKM